MENTKPADAPPEPRTSPHPAGDPPVSARLLALLPQPIPPWPLLLALVAVLLTLAVIALAVVCTAGPALATCGVLTSVIGTYVHRGKRHTRGRS